MLAIAQQMGGVGGALAAALLGAAAFAAAHLRPATTRPAAPAPAVDASSSEQETPSKAEGSEVVQVTASVGPVSRRDTPFPPPLGASAREEEIRKLKQKAAASEQNERRWREQGARGAKKEGEGRAWRVAHGAAPTAMDSALTSHPSPTKCHAPLPKDNFLLPPQARTGWPRCRPTTCSAACTGWRSWSKSSHKARATMRCEAD